VGLSLGQLLSTWRNDTSQRWLLHFLESRGVLVWIRRAVAGAGAALAMVVVLMMGAATGPQHPLARLLDWAVAVMALGWMIRWLLRPWPGVVQSLWLIGGADVAIALACWLDSDPLIGLAGTSAFLLPGVYVMFFHGAKAQLAHVGWVVLTVVTLAIAVGRSGPGLTGWSSAAAGALLSLIVTTWTLPALQLGFWLARQNAVDSLIDPLTGLANRRGLDYRLNRLPARSGSGSMCVFAVDLDDFKTINDRHGHQVGDRVLTQIAAGIQATMGAGALIARTGGEEFVAIALLESSSVRLLAERVRHAIADATDPPVTASIGVTVTTAHDLPRNDEITVALECADTAMYRAKRQGGNTVTVYSCPAYAEEIGRVAG
jgi:diguanylate cyclase (GGDEF)-like protein